MCAPRGLAGWLALVLAPLWRTAQNPHSHRTAPAPAHPHLGRDGRSKLECARQRTSGPEVGLGRRYSHTPVPAQVFALEHLAWSLCEGLRFIRMEDYESPVRSKGPLESQSTFSGKNPSSNPWRPQVRRRALPTAPTERVPWNPLPPSTHRPVMIAHIALWPTASGASVGGSARWAALGQGNFETV
ncbi:hypothetical protein BKA56DRAFT_713364 [Ilyonectria sp. MPI-CAGE-AT-0026]|nr:hypothetical protein BKA56DRAFT_713364 [Ilyonectria sp. MPI-CAGE-AT-0026]